MRKRYPSDLTDDPWEVLQPLVPPAKPGGRPRSVDMREVLNTLFSKARTGCQPFPSHSDLSTTLSGIARMMIESTRGMFAAARVPYPSISTARASL